MARVIVRCERCDTRFKLDESRLPARGARVRCSRCKHAFFVQPPGADPEAVVHGLAEEAAHEKTRPPEAAWDLDDAGLTGGLGARRSAAIRKTEPDPGRTQRGRDAVQRSSSAATPEEEEDGEWTFEDEVPGFAGGAGSLDMPDSGAAGPPFESDPNESSFAGLGDPESWDLRETPPPMAPAPAPAPAPTLAAAPPVASAPPASPAQSGPQPARAATAAPGPELRREMPTPVAAAEQTARAVLATQEDLAGRAGWAAVGLLSLAIGLGALRAPVRAEALPPTPIEGLELSALHGRWIENALAGPILVVSGEFRNAGAAPRAVGSVLVASLLSADGAPLEDAEATAGPSLAPERLREEAPDLLRAELENGAVGLAADELPPGQSVAFDAVFARAPAAAARFDLGTRPLGAAARSASPAPREPSAEPPSPKAP